VRPPLAYQPNNLLGAYTPTRGGWKSELNQVISKVRNKVDVADIRACQDLSSYQDDARQTAHSLNHTLKYHHSLTKG
jgi:hypothetical protein